jgi:dTDP-4-dehydrorhamnose 3,5-epimerase-like enzyme
LARKKAVFFLRASVFICAVKFVQTPIAGAYVIHLEPRADDRGWFSRFFCQREFEEHGGNEPRMTLMARMKYADESLQR